VTPIRKGTARRLGLRRPERKARGGVIPAGRLYFVGGPDRVTFVPGVAIPPSMAMVDPSALALRERAIRPSALRMHL
jgi:hypothetical protein